MPFLPPDHIGDCAAQRGFRIGRLGRWELNIATGQLTCDDRWYAIMGRSPAQPIGSIAEFQPLVHPDDRDRATEVSDTVIALAKSQEDYGMEYRILRPDGEIRWVRSFAALVDEIDGVPQRAIGFLHDVTEAIQQEQHIRRDLHRLTDANAELASEKLALEKLSLTDGLTGIANRRCFDAAFDRLANEWRRDGGAFSLVMLDIDHFKSYNDGYGHLAGDRALQAVAGVLQSSGRHSRDLAARYGGEEFALLMPRACELLDHLGSIVQQTRMLGIPHRFSPAADVITISAGGVTAPSSFRCMNGDLLEMADEALYTAKRQGRNGLHIVNPAEPT